MFHGLDEARMKIQNIRAIKQAKSGDTVKEGICERMRKFVQGNDKYDIESIVILASTNDLRHKNVTPESLIFQLQSKIQKLQVSMMVVFLSVRLLRILISNLLIENNCVQ